MVGLSTRGILGTEPVSWTVSTILRKVLYAFFGRTSNGCAPYDHSYVPYRLSRALVLPSWSLLLGRVGFFLVDEPLKLPLFNEGLNLLLQIVAVGCVVSMITVKMAILIHWPLTGISL